MLTFAPSPPPVGDGMSSNPALPISYVAIACAIGALLVRCGCRRRHKPALRVGSVNEDLQTHIYIEAAEISCDFEMQISSNELLSKRAVLDAITRAGFEATGIPFELSSARVESMDELGNAMAIKTDADCEHLRYASGIRVTQSSPRSVNDGMILLDGHDDDDDGQGVSFSSGGGEDRESLLLRQF